MIKHLSSLWQKSTSNRGVVDGKFICYVPEGEESYKLLNEPAPSTEGQDSFEILNTALTSTLKQLEVLRAALLEVKK